MNYFSIANNASGKQITETIKLFKLAQWMSIFKLSDIYKGIICTRFYSKHYHKQFYFFFSSSFRVLCNIFWQYLSYPQILSKSTPCPLPTQHCFIFFIPNDLLVRPKILWLCGLPLECGTLTRENLWENLTVGNSSTARG